MSQSNKANDHGHLPAGGHPDPDNRRVPPTHTGQFGGKTAADNFRDNSDDRQDHDEQSHVRGKIPQIGDDTKRHEEDCREYNIQILGAEFDIQTMFQAHPVHADTRKEGPDDRRNSNCLCHHRIEKCDHHRKDEHKLRELPGDLGPVHFGNEYRDELDTKDCSDDNEGKRFDDRQADRDRDQFSGRRKIDTDREHDQT